MTDEATDWKEGLPAELVAAPYFRSAPNLEQAIADMSRAAENQGNSIRIPGPDASDEARGEFYDRIAEKAPGLMRKPADDDQAAYDSILTTLGRPEDASGYKLPEVDGIALTDEKAGEFKAMAHAAGLTGKQFDAMMKSMLTKDAEGLTAREADHASRLGELKGEWGAAHEQRMAKITKMLEATGADPALLESVTTGKADAQALRWFHSLADQLGSGSEGGAVGAQGKTEPAPILTPDEALAQLGELEAKLIGNATMPHDQAAALSRKRMKLMKLAYPDSSTDDTSLRRSIYGGG